MFLELLRAGGSQSATRIQNELNPQRQALLGNKIDQYPGDDRPEHRRMLIFNFANKSTRITFEYIYLHYFRRRIRL